MNLFELNDYKAALNAILEEKRKTQKGLSRKLSEFLGVHPTLVSQVLKGPKDFTEEQMLVVCEFLGVAKLETKFLLALVQYERAGTMKLKEHVSETIAQLRQKALKVSERVPRDRYLSEQEKAIFYSSWIFSAVHLLSTLEKPLDFDALTKRLNIPHSKAREVLDFLLNAQMVSEVNGKFVSGATVTHLEKGSLFVSKHHTNWRLKAIQASEVLTDEELMYSGNFSVSKKDFALLREKLVHTIKDFIAVVKDSPAEDIAQFNIDFFWIKN